MDRNTIIGIVLIFLLFYVWARMNAPTEDQLAEMRTQDSLAQVEAEALALDSNIIPLAPQVSPEDTLSTQKIDSMAQLEIANDFGAFAKVASGEETIDFLENDVLKVDFSSKGGVIKKGTLKQYKKLVLDEEHQEVYLPLELLEDEKNSFSYQLPVPNSAAGLIRTSDLYFSPKKEDNVLTYTADLGGGRSIEQVYTISPDGYDLDYAVRFKGMHQVLDAKRDVIELNWINYLDRIEENYQYEKIYSTVYYKEVDDDPNYCSCRNDDLETLDSEPVKWVSNSNQFFNSALIAEESFRSAVVETRMLEEDAEDLKLLVSQFAIPFQGSGDETFAMKWYIGPNDFEILQAYNLELQDIIPFGSSIFGTINRWIIRPIFSFLSKYIGSKGIVILLLTLIVKSLVYPLTYKMLHSQSKMGALKPEMAKLKEKYKDDQQKVQMETMKIYREYGVNPAGGCFPMVLQMPIWFALYRFFPASIEFRQASFLWANDLSSYDVFFWLSFEIPFLGSHVSLFTILWAISILAYTYYNSQIMDMSSINPMMKYMQYLMPLMFIFFFNSYASGLTCYLLFSNMLNIVQTLVTKNYLIDNTKIKEELNANKKKPKKKGGFQARLEKALKEQQRVAEDKSQKSRKG